MIRVGNHINDLLHNAANAAGDHLIPAPFTKATRRQMPFNIVKGQLNAIYLRPEVLNEHFSQAKSTISTVDATNIVGQIFKASQDNIVSAYLTLDNASVVDIDDFESYASDAELQATWVASADLATLDLTVMGSQSLKAPSGAVVGRSWTTTFPAADMTDFTGSFSFRQTAPYETFKVRVFVGDGVYTQSAALPVAFADTKVHFDIDIEAMTADDGVNFPDHALITQIGFIVEEKSVGAFFYVDDITSTPLPGSIELKLWDMGPDIPVSGITSINDGTQYESIGELSLVAPSSSVTLALRSGKRLYHLHEFLAGASAGVPGNELLNVGNYYALTLHYIDTEIAVKGTDASRTTDRYVNGYAFHALSESAPIIKATDYADIMFGISSCQDVWVFGAQAIADEAPNGGAEFHSFIRDENLKILEVIHSHGVIVPQEAVLSLSTRPAFLPKGGRFEIRYGDDYSDDVSKIYLSMEYLYEPQEVNG